MDMEFRRRNNDLGICVPTFQERVNTMLPAERPAASPEDAALGAADVMENASFGMAQTSAAPELAPSGQPMTPHMPDDNEVQTTLDMMAEAASRRRQELAELHSNLNEKRIIRLLGLLE